MVLLNRRNWCNKPQAAVVQTINWTPIFCDNFEKFDRMAAEDGLPLAQSKRMRTLFLMRTQPHEEEVVELVRSR